MKNKRNLNDTNEVSYKNIGQNLRNLRHASGLSQEKLCYELRLRGCEINKSAYAKCELGNGNIKISVLVALQSLYQCDYDDFFKDL